MLHTSFDMLGQAQSWTSGPIIREFGGAKSYGPDTPIPLSWIADRCGIATALCCLRHAVPTESIAARRLSRTLACDFAQRVLWIFEEACPGDHRPRLSIEAARRFLQGKMSEWDLDKAGDVAWVASWERRGMGWPRERGVALACSFVASRAFPASSVHDAIMHIPGIDVDATIQAHKEILARRLAENEGEPNP